MKHHYLPEFYLKQWAGPDGRLCEFSNPYNKVKPRMTHPGGTGYVENLYRIANAPPNLQDVFETRFLSIADGQAAEALRVMVDENAVPTDHLKIAWARFMMSLVYRTPEGVARSTEMIRKHYEEGTNFEEFQAEYARIKKSEDPETVQEYLQTGMPRIIGRTMINHLMDIIESPRVLEALSTMKWFIVRSNDVRFPLLTSDRPIVMTNGISHPNSHMIMPISPRYNFLAARTDDEIAKMRRIWQDGVMTSALNDNVIRQARKYAYGTDDRQLRFVANRLGEKKVCSPFE